ncbi:threonine dehydratase [Alkaliphilus peptidifermentans DSM 18978]|uniref:threonine ammonia-lyase n=2 Tax=Alkaliphilus TaxID=114627 RepID=A0A1G5JTF3_9FIRM|nr:threonine dehydratase [Alkaliphilus peptidifermentans DSM 18978]
MAALRIAPFIRKTPLVAAESLAEISGAEKVMLKLESLQNTGAFKVRGAANKILGLSEDEKARGVITFSTGNHGRAVAYVAKQMNIRAVVCLSEHVPKNRVELIKDMGAEVEVHGRSQDEAEKHFDYIMEKQKLMAVPPFDDPAIIAGQGTVALEILTEKPELDILLVPLSGGGLLAGVALVAKAINPSIRVVGVSIEASPAMLESLKAGKPVEIEEKNSLAVSLLGGIGQQNNYTLTLIKDLVDEHIIINEMEIAEGMLYALKSHGLVIEGAAAVGIAALLKKKVSCQGSRVGVVVSGSSIELESYFDLIKQQLSCGKPLQSSKI